MVWPIFRGLFDDASLFPPASLPMADAVAGHLRHQAAWYREMSGPFVCADTNLTELSAALTAAGLAELDLALVLPGGVAGLDAAVDGVFSDPRLRLRAVEVPAAARDSITTAVAEVAAALDRTPLAGAAAFIEVPARDFTTAAARAVDERRYLAKVRTGGTTAQAVPDDQTLANCLVTMAQARLAFKCTAGVHHAVRHRAADTGFEHHGFLNVLLAVAAALDDASPEQVAAELADRDAARVAAKIRNLDAETVSAVRSRSPRSAPAVPTSRSTTWLRLALSARTSRQLAPVCLTHLRSCQPAGSVQRPPDVSADPMRPANMARFIFMNPAVTERDGQPVRKPTVWRAERRIFRVIRAPLRGMRVAAD